MPDFFENEHDLEYRPGGPIPWFRVLVTGSREWSDITAIPRILSDLLREHHRVTIVHGDCPTGADHHARVWAECGILHGMRHFEVTVRHEPYPALWNEFGKQAGPIRNRYMVGLGADVCLAFPTPSSRGTISCMDLAAAAGIPVINYGTPRENFP